MRRILNEVKRMQKIAGIISEASNAPQRPVNKAAMIADLQKKYGPLVPITPEDKKALDYAGIGVEHGSIAVLKTKTPKMIPGFGGDDQGTKVSYLNILPADEYYDAPYYFEVRETVEYPGDFEQGAGGYGEPNGIWNGTTFEPYSMQEGLEEDFDYEDFGEEELPPINKAELVSFIRQSGPKPVAPAPKGPYGVTLAYIDHPSIPDSYMTGARDVFMCVVKACGGMAKLNGAPGPEQNYTVKGCSFETLQAIWNFLASEQTYKTAGDSDTIVQANGCAQTWQIEMA